MSLRFTDPRQPPWVLLNRGYALRSNVPDARPGLRATTLDFPGGRVPVHQSPQMSVSAILKRDLDIQATEIATLTALNQKGWAVNSSFSNQNLYGFIAELKPETQISSQYIGASYEATEAGIASLLDVLTCLQCRTVLLEWHLQYILK